MQGGVVYNRLSIRQRLWLLVLGPIVIIVGLLRLAKARVDRVKGNDSVSD